MLTAWSITLSAYGLLTYVTGSLLFAAALFTYEQSILFPLVLMFVTYSTIDQRLRRQQLVYLILLVVTAAAYVITRKIITADIVGAYEGSNYLALHLSTLIGNLVRFGTRLVLNPASTYGFIAGVIILIIFLGVMFLLMRKSITVINRNAVVFFMSALLLLIIPVLSLGISTHSFESGRYLYLPSIFMMMAIAIGAINFCRKNYSYRNAFIGLLMITSVYWLYGKVTAASNYKQASSYASTTTQAVLKHFSTSGDTLYIDTLRVSIHRLPVFRSSFKTGIKWLNETVDTNKIVVQHMIEENEGVQTGER